MQLSLRKIIIHLHNLKGKMKKQKITLLSYIKRNKLLFGGYLLFTTFSHLVNIVSIFLIAAFIAEITVVNFDLAFTYLIYGTILIVLRRIFYMTAGLFFIKMFGKMAFEMRYDLVNHSFKLTSQTYSESSSGKFIKRISQDPKQAIESMDSIVEPISIIFGFLITIIYIITINIWIGLLVITTVIGLVILELIRTKIFYKNRKLVKIADENIASLVGEIVRSEKDIKALNLENELIEVSNKNFLNYKECFNKSYIKNETLSGFRNVIFELCLAIILIVGLTFVQNTYITLASFLFIFMNRDALNSAIYCFGLITQNISMCKLSSQRMFELFDAEKYPIEKFGNTEMAECRGEISFDNVSFYYEKTNEDKKEENNKQKNQKK